MTTFIALLRAVNVGGRKVEMAELRRVAEKAGFKQVRTFIASGNLLVDATDTVKGVRAKLEDAIAKAFGIEVPVIVRTAEQWKAYLDPPKAFAKAAQEAPGFVHLVVANAAPPKEAAKAIEAKGTAGEQAIVAGDAIWIHYPAGQGASKVTPSAVNKAVGSPATARNLNTVRKLAELAGASQ